MSRRAAAGALVVAGAVLGVPPSHSAGPPPPLMPSATCATRVTDATGDGVPKIGIETVQGVPSVADPRGNVTSLDITGVTFRLTGSRVYAFLSLADVTGTFRETDSAYGFTMWFTRGTKVVRFDQVYANPAYQAQGLAPTAGYPTASVGTTASGGPLLRGVGGGVDPAANVAYVYADRASLDEQLGEPLLEGEEVTAINARSELWTTKGDVAPGVVRRPADATAVAPASATWRVGDERCFPASRVVVSDVSAQHGDAATLTVTLTDAAGAPLAGRPVAWRVPGESAPRLLTTGGTGVITVPFAAAPVAGTYPVTVTYEGDDYTGDGRGTGTLTVRAEAARFAPLKVAKAGTARTVTVTLTDDDPAPMPKQPVTWYVNGKKVATTVTDAAGRAVFKGARPGQKVQARFAGATGRYAAATSATVTA